MPYCTYARSRGMILAPGTLDVGNNWVWWNSFLSWSVRGSIELHARDLDVRAKQCALRESKGTGRLVQFDRLMVLFSMRNMEIKKVGT